MGWSAWLGLPQNKPKSLDDDQIYPGEMKEAGFDIPAHDPRLKNGLRRSNLTPEELSKFDPSRKRKLQGS